MGHQGLLWEIGMSVLKMSHTERQRVEVFARLPQTAVLGNRGRWPSKSSSAAES